MTITGFLPCLSATTPQITEVRALPTINEAPKIQDTSFHKPRKLFQINKALTITDIVSSENNVPAMEHFQIYTPTFENGVNIATPVVFDETFIYLNYPNCYLNRSSQNTSTMYYCKSIYYHPMNTIPCVYLDGEYYLSFYLYTVYSDGIRGEENNYAYSFGMYYDTLMDIMEKEKYHTIDEYERTSFYGTISFDDFLNGVLK